MDAKTASIPTNPPTMTPVPDTGGKEMIMKTDMGWRGQYEGDELRSVVNSLWCDLDAVRPRQSIVASRSLHSDHGAVFSHHENRTPQALDNFRQDKGVILGE